MCPSITAFEDSLIAVACSGEASDNRDGFERKEVAVTKTSNYC